MALDALGPAYVAGVRHVIPFWWDMGAVAVFSLAVFFLSQLLALPWNPVEDNVAEADMCTSEEDIDSESAANFDLVPLELNLARLSSVGSAAAVLPGHENGGFAGREEVLAFCAAVRRSLDERGPPWPLLAVTEQGARTAPVVLHGGDRRWPRRHNAVTMDDLLVRPGPRPAPAPERHRQLPSDRPAGGGPGGWRWRRWTGPARGTWERLSAWEHFDVVFLLALVALALGLRWRTCGRATGAMKPSPSGSPPIPSAPSPTTWLTTGLHRSSISCSTSGWSFSGGPGRPLTPCQWSLACWPSRHVVVG